jgi:hypothetical protein
MSRWESVGFFAPSSTKLTCWVGAFLLAVVAGDALAGPINYGNRVGDTVTYQMITESSPTDPQYFPPNLFPPNAGLFGEPVVSGDSLDFTPRNFFALSDFQAPPLDRTDGHLTFMIQAHNGNGIDNISFQEGGALSVGGFGTNQTFVDVSAVGFLQVHAIDNIPIDVETFPINMKFNFGSNPLQDNGQWRLGSEGPMNGFLWTGGQFFDIEQGLVDRGYTVNLGATKISVNLDNLLYAQSQPLAGAFIDKKDFGGLTITVNVPGGGIPEPTSASLVALGLVGMACWGRRANRGRISQVV